VPINIINKTRLRGERPAAIFFPRWQIWGEDVWFSRKSRLTL